MTPADALDPMRQAQARWRQTPVADRLAVLGRLRGLLVDRAGTLAGELTKANPRRTHVADTLAAEVLPLVAAIRFLEKRAGRLLRPKRVGAWGRPIWLWGVRGEVRREPWGVVLVIGPSNYPLLLPGVQAIQALAAGNAVVLKPGNHGTLAAQRLAEMLTEAGLDGGLVRVADESIGATTDAIATGVDKVVLTGSADAGRAVLTACAPRLIPATVELSGCDAVWVGPGADLDRVARALTYGCRLNTAATCIAPHRVFVHSSLAEALTDRLRQHLAALDPMAVGEAVAKRLADAAEDAVARGAACVQGERTGGDTVKPYLLTGATPEMHAMRADLFGPMLAVMEVADERAMLTADAACPMGLGVAVFGEGESVIDDAAAGSVTIEDIIVPTADPRLPFGGWNCSGFGVTRGAEGLLEMTRPKVVTRHRGSFRPHYDAPTDTDAELAKAYLVLAHGSGLRSRLGAARRLLRLIKQGS